MNGTEILTKIDLLGATVSLSEDGSKIRVSDPHGAITEELKEELREAKAQLIPLLKNQSQWFDEVMNMTHEEFKTRKIAIRIRSEILGEDFWLVFNEQTKSHLNAEGLVCYLPEEIPNLMGLSKERLRYINEVKKIFEGSRVVESKLKGNLKKEARYG